MARPTARLILTFALAALAAAGCAKEPAPLPGAGQDAGSAPGVSRPDDAPVAGNLPEGHPPVSGGQMPMGQAGVPGELVLKPEGIGSQAELDHCLSKIPDTALQARFEQGFRACFTSVQAARDYGLAAAAMNDVLAKMPGFAPAYRTLAYAKLNTNFDMEGATGLYEKAVELDPEYGEAHYALAFMLTQIDPERGRTHFEKAMSLGVPDERDLRNKFYPSGT